MARRILTVLGLALLVVTSAILAAPEPGMTPATGAQPIPAMQNVEARPTDPHDLSTFDRQLQPGAVITGLTAVTR